MNHFFRLVLHFCIVYVFERLSVVYQDESRHCILGMKLHADRPQSLPSSPSIGPAEPVFHEQRHIGEVTALVRGLPTGFLSKCATSVVVMICGIPEIANVLSLVALFVISNVPTPSADKSNMSSVAKRDL